MYQSHWGLERPPFPSGLNSQMFYEGVNQREALARLRFLVGQDRRLGLVLGEPGLGKSLLLEVVADQLRPLGHAIATIDLLGISAREFYGQLATQLGARARVEDDLVRLFRLVNDRLHENQLQDISTIVLLDDADQAGPDLLKQISRLVRSAERRLTFVVACNGSQVSRLGNLLLDRVDLRVDLAPWDELDTIGYLQLALVEAGAQRPLFDDTAMAELYHLTEGVPRRVQRLADYALLAGSGDALETIDVATIRAAHEAISLPVLA